MYQYVVSSQVIFICSFVSTSLAYIIIPKNKKLGEGKAFVDHLLNVARMQFWTQA